MTGSDKGSEASGLALLPEVMVALVPRAPSASWVRGTGQQLEENGGCARRGDLGGIHSLMREEKEKRSDNVKSGF